MKKIGIFLLAASFLLQGISPSMAEETAIKMAQNCRPIADIFYYGVDNVKIPDTYEVGKCGGYFAAFQIFLSATQTDDRGENAKPLISWYCPATPPSVAQMAAVFIKYVEEHPERGNEFVFIVANDAFREAWPC